MVVNILPSKKKAWINYIYTPIFLQQLGLFSPEKICGDKVSEFIEYIPEKYRLVDICIGQRPQGNVVKIKERSNFRLDLRRPYKALEKDYSSDCRRNIRISQNKDQILDQGVKPGELIEHFSRNRGTGIKGIRKTDYIKLSKLMDYCISNSKGEILGVRNNSNLIYGVFIITLSNTCVSLGTSTSRESNISRTGYFVVDHLVKEFSEKLSILDFAGSSIKGISDFVRSFGASNIPYYRIYRNNLPWPLKLIK